MHCAGALVVSIRSPHKSKGRPSQSSTPAFGLAFQSAPLTKARGDIESELKLTTGHKFQSAPLTKARGDPDGGHERGCCILFQSAPLTKARGDLMVMGLIVVAFSVSIRSPHKSKGRPDDPARRCL